MEEELGELVITWRKRGRWWEGNERERRENGQNLFYAA